MEKIEHIPVKLKPEKIRAVLRIKRDKDWDPVRSYIEAAEPLISAKAAYKVVYIAEKEKDAVIVDGIRFKSRVLRKNFDTVERVFPYVVTIGAGLEELAGACEDLFQKYCLDVIGNLALVKARNHMRDEVRSRFALDGMSFMSPGSLKDWPIEEQVPLFSLLGDVKTSIGVSLNDNLLMIPRKSVSGIYFPTEISFYSCQLCPRERCPGRRAQYNEVLAREYGILK
jgi:hypothetical protein